MCTKTILIEHRNRDLDDNLSYPIMLQSSGTPRMMQGGVRITLYVVFKHIAPGRNHFINHNCINIVKSLG